MEANRPNDEDLVLPDTAKTMDKVTEADVRGWIQQLEDTLLEAPRWVIPADPVEAKRFSVEKADLLLHLSVSSVCQGRSHLC